MASQMVTTMLLHTEKNARFIERIQARHYALGAEQYVAYLLEEDFVEDQKKRRLVDHENERWNIRQVDYYVDQGSIDLVVVDEQGRFNINWLTLEGKAGEKFMSMFKNLLQTQKINIELADWIQTWLGAAPAPANGPAADTLYLMLDPPMRAANTEISSVSELKLVEGMTAEYFERLAPLLSALPKASKININTALPEVICSISDKITENDAEAIIEGRGHDGFAKIDELSNVTEVIDKMADLKSAKLVFSSQYFSTYIKATYRDTSFYMKTLLFRNNEGQVQIAGREIGPNSYWITDKMAPEAN